MEVKASLRNACISALKARAAADLIRGRDVNQALGILSQSRRKAGRMTAKLLKSALANAEQKKVLDIDSLYIKTICVDKAGGLQRFRPGARGSPFHYQRQRSHIFLVLDEKS